MPVTWSLHPTGEFALLTIASPYTLQEWQRALDEILADPAVPARLLVDRREAGTPTFDLVAEMVDYLRAHADRLWGIVAAVVVRGEASYGMARALEIRAEVIRLGVTTKVFTEYEDAVRWLTSAGPA